MGNVAEECCTMSTSVDVWDPITKSSVNGHCAYDTQTHNMPSHSGNCVYKHAVKKHQLVNSVVLPL